MSFVVIRLYVFFSNLIFLFFHFIGSLYWNFWSLEGQKNWANYFGIYWPKRNEWFYWGFWT